MKVEIITFDADPDHGGYGARVHGLARMFGQFAEVRVVLTDWFRAPEVPGVTYECLPLKDTAFSRLRRLQTYYKTDFPKRSGSGRPDLVLVESLDVLGLHQYGDSVPFILDEHNVYWELLEYEMVNAPFFKTWLGRRERIRRWLLPRLRDRAKAFEVEALRRATRIFVTSERDRHLIGGEFSNLERKILVLPNCVDLDRFRVSTEAGDLRDVAFVGNYNYVPNRDAAMFISRALAPAVPEARFVLCGSNPPAEALQPPNVFASGFVPDLNDAFESAAVCIAPLTHGSGTRLKILEYLAAGKAVVATPKACEGLDVEDGVHILIRDDAEAFAYAIRTLLRDEEFRRRLGANGRMLVERKYDWRAYVDWLGDVVRDILAAPQLRRTA